MGRLREERFGRIWRGVEKWEWRQVVETAVKWEQCQKEKENKHQ